MTEELRRKRRVKACCRVIVRDRYGMWSGVTDDIGETGCRVMTNRLLRAGTSVVLTVSSDLFSEELEITGEAVWATSDRLGIEFGASPTRRGAMTPAQFVAALVEHGAGGMRTRAAPAVLRSARGRAQDAEAPAPAAAPAQTTSPSATAQAVALRRSASRG